MPRTTKTRRHKKKNTKSRRTKQSHTQRHTKTNKPKYLVRYKIMGGINTICKDIEIPTAQSDVLEYFNQFVIFAECCFKMKLVSKDSISPLLPKLLEDKKLYTLKPEIPTTEIPTNIVNNTDNNTELNIVLIEDDINKQILEELFKWGYFEDSSKPEAQVVVKTYNIALRLLASAIRDSNETELEAYGNSVKDQYGMRSDPTEDITRERIRNTLYDLENHMLKKKWVKYKHLDEDQSTPTTTLILGKSYSYYAKNGSASTLFQNGKEFKNNDLSQDNQFQLGKYKKYYTETYHQGSFSRAEGLYIYQFENGSLYSHFEPNQGNVSPHSMLIFTRLP